MSGSSFGRWYEEKKNEEENVNGDTSTGGTMAAWFPLDTEQLPLFNTESLQTISFSNMKQTMENQMPKKILGMGYQQRFKVFCALLFLSILFFGLAFFVGMPMMAIRPQKFALSFTCGSLTFMSSFGIMKGPYEHICSMLQPDRLLFTTIYVGSMIWTLYCTFTFSGASGYVTVMVASGCQLIALIWYLISFLPGGTAGLKYVLVAMAHILKPVIVACAKFQAMCLTQCCRGWMAWRSSASGSGSSVTPAAVAVAG